MSCKWEVSEKKTRNGRTDQCWIYWVPRVSYIQPAMIGSNTTTSVPHTAQSNKTFIQKLTSSWTPCFSSPSTVHLMTEGGLDSWLEQTKLTALPIWALSGPLIWTLSPETANIPITLRSRIKGGIFNIWNVVRLFPHNWFFTLTKRILQHFMCSSP